MFFPQRLCVKILAQKIVADDGGAIHQVDHQGKRSDGKGGSERKRGKGKVGVKAEASFGKSHQNVE